MKLDRVNLRSSLHVGVSTLLFDVYGAPMYSRSVLRAVSARIDYDLGRSLRLVVDPVEFAMPIRSSASSAVLRAIRFVVGLQFGG